MPHLFKFTPFFPPFKITDCKARTVCMVAEFHQVHVVTQMRQMRYIGTALLMSCLHMGHLQYERARQQLKQQHTCPQSKRIQSRGRLRQITQAFSTWSSGLDSAACTTGASVRSLSNSLLSCSRSQRAFRWQKYRRPTQRSTATPAKAEAMASAFHQKVVVACSPRKVSKSTMLKKYSDPLDGG